MGSVAIVVVIAQRGVFHFCFRVSIAGSRDLSGSLNMFGRIAMAGARDGVIVVIVGGGGGGAKAEVER